MVFQLLSFKERRHGPGRVGSGRSYVRFHYYVEENFARASRSLVMKYFKVRQETLYVEAGGMAGGRAPPPNINVIFTGGLPTFTVLVPALSGTFPHPWPIGTMFKAHDARVFFIIMHGSGG